MINIELYSDGSCSGNPGPGGFCTILICPELGITDDKAIAIYGGNEDTTNNKMEIRGIYEGVKAISELLDNQSRISKFINESNLYNIDALGSLESSKDINVSIFSDSSYAIKSIFEWIHNWIENDWVNSKGEPVKNKEIIQLTNEIASCFNEVKWSWIKGHNNNKYNEKCDSIAVQASKNKMFEDVSIMSVDILS